MVFMSNFDAHNRPMSEINVTPMVDVMLVLLVIFMVTAPMMVQGLKVDLPEAKAQAMTSSDEKLTLTLSKERHVFIGETKVELAKLEETLRHNEKLKKDREIFLEADKDLPYGFVARVMAIAKAGGAEKIGMVTRDDDHV